MILVLLAAVLIIIVLSILTKLFSLWNLARRTKTNGPGLGSIFQRFQFQYRQLRQVSQKQKEGFIHYFQGSKLVLLAIDPDSAKFVLKNLDVIPKYKGLTAASPGFLFESFGKHIGTANGDNWKKHKNIINFGFTSKAYQEYFPIFLSFTEKALSKIETESKNGDVHLQPLFSKFTLDLLGKSIFHYDFGRMDEKSTNEYNAYADIMGRFRTWTGLLLRIFPWAENVPLPGVSKLRNSVDKLKSFFLEIVKERHDGQHYNDILGNLISSSQTEEGLSQVELLSNIWAFFVAGHETTASALTWACICLALYPDVQEKLYQEIENVIGNRTPTIDELSNLQYLDCFINEVLRLYSPVSLIPSRYAVKDVTYNNQLIPKGCIVGIYIEAIHRNPEFWPNPDLFDPDRFSPENKKGRNHYAYLPFSLGPRQCIGNNFSLIEQRLFLTKLLQKFRVLPPKNSPLHKDAVTFHPIHVQFQLR